MNFLLRWIGDGSGEFNRLRPHVDALFEPLGLALLAAALGLSLGWHWTGLAGVAGRRRWAMMGLRAGALALVVGVLLRWGLALQHARYDPVPVAVAVDRSASMRFEDGGEPRAERVRRLLARDEAWQALERRYRVDYYTVGERLEKTDRAALAASAEATDGRTRLLPAVEAFSNAASGVRYAAALLFSDGADNGRLGAADREGELDSSLLGPRPVPIHAVQIGARADYDDFGIAGGTEEEFAFTQTPLTLSFTVSRQGFESVDSLAVNLHQEDTLIETRWIDWTAPEWKGKPRAECRFTFTPRQTGDFLYKVSLDAPEGDRIAANNLRVFALKVIRDKIRVLHITGQPSFDTMALRQLMKKNPNIDLIAFYILRSNSDAQLYAQDAYSLIPFPTEDLFFKELHGFDLVIFHNFKYGPYVPGLFLENLRGYLQDGGAFAMIGGGLSFGEGGYDRTAIEDILPVSVGVREGYADGGFSVALSEAGRAHPITRGEVEADPAAVLADLPPLAGLNLIGGPKADALVLLEAQLQGSVARRPLLAIQESGKGRSLALATDTLWRWQFQTPPESPGAKTYTNLWNRAIRWLIRDPFLDRLRIATSQANYSGNEKIAGSVTLFAPDYRRAPNQEVVLEWTREAGPEGAPGSAGESGLLSGFTDDQGSWRFEFEPPADGGYRLRAFAPSPNPDQQVEAFTVAGYTRQGPETLEPGAQPAILEFLAKASGGSFHRLEAFQLEAVPLPAPQAEVVDRQQVLELWDEAGWLLAAIGLLGAGWWLRKKSGLA